MKAAQINSYGNGTVRVNMDAPEPKAAPGKILVEVHAAGANPFDWKLAKGMFQEMMPFPLPGTLGGDFSGVVAESDNARFKRGDAVYGQAHVFSGGSGSFAEVLSANIGNIAEKPERLSHVEAAALPLTGASAIQALIDSMHLTKGMKILIHGGAGGIGTIAIQLARHLGAYVATTVTKKDEAYAKKFGADTIIDYESERFEDVAKGYDAVFDTVGGETYARSFKVLKKGGIIVSMLEQPNEQLMGAYGVKAVSQSTQVTRARLEKLKEFVDERAIQVNVDKTFSLEDAAAALAYLETGHPKGKVVLKIR